MTYIDQHKDEHGVEPICRVLTDAGVKIAPSTYYATRGRAASKRAVRDSELTEQIRRVHDVNYGVYGVRKVWHALRRDGVRVARCTVERLMRAAGVRVRPHVPSGVQPDVLSFGESLLVSL